MKKLLLVRHAKSSYDNPALADFDRPLSKRGQRDAPLMALQLEKRAITPDLLVSSPAKRAIDTACLIADGIGFSTEQIITDAGIYEADTEELMSIIRAFHDSFNTVMLFGHNPAFHNAAHFLTRQKIEKFPTCGICCVQFEVDSWRKIIGTPGELAFFIYPKLYRKNN